eukprot:3113060-Pyramimonas_sp.AAC.2
MAAEPPRAHPAQRGVTHRQHPQKETHPQGQGKPLRGPGKCPATSQQASRLAPLEGLRALLTLWIMYFHFNCIDVADGPAWIGHLRARAPSGIPAFIALSGFVTALSDHGVHKVSKRHLRLDLPSFCPSVTGHS